MNLRRLLQTRRGLSTAAANSASEECKSIQVRYTKALELDLQRANLTVDKVAFTTNSPYLYRACTTSPEKLLAQGGWKATNDEKATIYSDGNNAGMVCFTESLQVASIFLRHKLTTLKHPQTYLYAISPTGHFYKPKSAWQQYCVAGAYSIGRGFAARAVISLGTRSIALADAKFHGCTAQDFKKNMLADDKQVRSFLYKNVLTLPEEENFGDDSAVVFRLANKK